MTKKSPRSRHVSNVLSFEPTPAHFILAAAFCCGVASFAVSGRMLGQGLLAACVLLAAVSLVMNLRWTPNPMFGARGERRRRR